MKKAFKYRIYPTAEQRVFLGKTFGCCRFVWNQLLQRSKLNYEDYLSGKLGRKPRVTGYGFAYEVKELRVEFDFLKEVSYTSLQQKTLDLGKTFSTFFSRGGYPKYKSKKDHQSFRLTVGKFSVVDKGIKISRLKTPIRVNWSTRKLPMAPSQVTISLDTAGRYHVSFLCDVVATRQCGTGVVGVDLGLKDLMAFSTGEVISNPRHLNRALKKLRRSQRRLSRKVKGSNNRNKQRLKVARQYARIADIRNDHHHKLSTRLINENQVICLETLNVSGMMKNRCLSRHIADASWSKLVVYLGYKAAESGAKIVLIDPFYASTQTCSTCGHRLTGDAKLTLRDRSWTCPACQSTHDRDHNAALNILHEGLRVQDALSPGSVSLV